MHFSAPVSSDLVIFDETNHKLIQSVIPEDFTASIYKTRPVEFYITPAIFLGFIRNLTYFKFKNSGAPDRNLIYRIFWQLVRIYIKADLLSRNPKAIITSIDNCSKFAWLSENYHQAPCIAIQNGFRLSFGANSMDNYYCQHLFCFGERESIDFPAMNYKVDNFYPVGSLNLSLNFDRQLAASKPIYDLLVVSCWRGNIGYAIDVEDSMKAMRLMDEALVKYLENRNLKAAVILRSERDSDQWIMPEVGLSEEDYYKSIYGDLIEIIDVNFAEANVYPVMQSAEVVIASFGTTCLIEAFAMGRKILYLNFCDSKKYHVDFKPEIVFHGSDKDFQSFCQKLDALIDKPIDKYSTEYKDLMNYYIKTQDLNTTQQLIENEIINILSNFKCYYEKY